ncbi:hypothetical protein AK830_g1380 [Neonectria ditissima]|uniref:Nucleoside phosphorylase domain-containing protein n=1 Tax=Neonectria ditissima TaxID=78410 RepID=A0A0P7BX43_9HYPO|nr:hypothetical protein AK830_g1380 [Neonectria ditissima]
MASPPESRDDFEIAIVCALAREYNAVSRVVDQFWDINYGRVAEDPNTYATGRIGAFHVVLVLLSTMGKSSAASATANLRTSYPKLKFALLVGICGGVPGSANGEELLLGDVVIGKTVVQYDLSRRYPDGVQTKDTLDDNLGRSAKNVRNFVQFFETEIAREQLEERAALCLEELQTRTSGRRRNANYQYPGASRDILFKAEYHHKHQSSAQILCEVCDGESDRVCEESRNLSCHELGCDKGQTIERERLKENRDFEAKGQIAKAQAPCVFVGRFGSGDIVLKSGVERDTLARRHGILAFEMEGAGAWDEIPCIIVKGVSDYADSHKNKLWQDFAAATAACVAKALVERYPQTDKPLNKSSEKYRGDQTSESARLGMGSVRFGDISGGNVVTDIHSTGGTQTFNFGN